MCQERCVTLVGEEIAAAMVYGDDLGAALEAEGLTVRAPAAGV